MDQIESDISDEGTCAGWKQKYKAKRRTRLLSSDSSSSEKLNGEETTRANSDALGRNIELLTDLTIEENRPKKINSRSSSESVDGDDELSRNGELPADMVTTKRRRRKRMRILQRSSSSESVEDEAEFRSATPTELYFQKCSSPPTLDDLPDEILNRILTKAIIKIMLTEKPASSLTEVDSKHAISQLRCRLRGVSSNWNNCLSSEWFGDVLDSTVNQLVPPIQSVALEFVAKLECSNVVGVTTLGKKVYVLQDEGCCTVRIYEGNSPPAYHSEIDFDHIRNPTDIVACKKTKVLYIGGRDSKCIWQIPARNIQDDKNIEPWMENVENVDTFSVTDEGRLLIPRNKPFDHIGVYNSNAQLIHRIFLPSRGSYPGHVVEKSNGNVVLSHNFSFSLSELNSAGRFVRRYKFCPREGLLSFRGFLFNHFVLDADERVIAVNVNGQEIVCFDPTLRQGKVIATEETCVVCPTRVHYDKKNSKLIVVGLDSIAFLNVWSPVTCKESN